MTQDQTPMAHPIVSILVAINIDKILALCGFCNKWIWLKESDIMTYSVDVIFF